MSFVRPELQAALWRWREVLTGGFIALLGLYWIAGPGGLLGWVGVPVTIGGGALCVIGVQRLRFRSSGAGPGTVDVDEGQIIYFGPLTGGSVDVADLQQIALDPSAHPPHWVLQQPGRPPLHIPVNAAGADALFDVFSSLPGLKTERMLAALHDGSPQLAVIWRRGAKPGPVPRLH